MGSYYDVDAILTDAHKLPCSFEIDVPGLGYLDENPGGDIKANTTLSLPLWLSTLLAVQRLPSSSSSSASAATLSQNPTATSLCTLDLPASLSPRVLNALKADPCTVDLRSLAQQFYDVAARVLELFEEEEVVDVLCECFKRRAGVIGDFAARGGGSTTGAGGGGGGGDFLRGLDFMEEALFKGAFGGGRGVRRWLGEGRGTKGG